MVQVRRRKRRSANEISGSGRDSVTSLLEAREKVKGKGELKKKTLPVSHLFPKNKLHRKTVSEPFKRKKPQT